MEGINYLKLLNIGYALSFFCIGYLIARHVSLVVERSVIKRFSRHHAMLASRIIFYILFLIFIVSGLHQLGLKLTVFLGAAGLFTVALSFASQTAASNLISGIFLLIEHPFKVGDLIEVKGINGTVDSIDLLSTKLKTADNRLVRIANEVMIKAEIINFSYFTTRRIDIIIGIAYDSDIERVKALLLAIASSCESTLKDPPANVIINNFADSAVELKLMVWVNNYNLNEVRNILQESIKQRFDEEGIEIPFPQVTIRRG